MASSEETGLERPKFLIVGCVISPFGIAGEVRVECLTDFPERFTPDLVLCVGDDLQQMRIEAVRWQQGRMYLKFASCDAHTAEGLSGRLLRVPVEQAVALPDEHYFIHDVVGLEVWATDGRLLGQLHEILRTGANDVYVVRGQFGEVLIPAIESVVTSIDLAGGRMIVELIDGML